MITCSVSCHVGRDALLLYWLCGFRRYRCLEDYLEQNIQLTIGELVSVEGGVKVHSEILQHQYGAIVTNGATSHEHCTVYYLRGTIV